MQLSLNASSFFLHTFWAPLDFTRLNFESTVHKIFFHIDNSIFTYFLANISLYSWWVFERNSFLCGTLALSPLTFNQFRIVNGLTWIPCSFSRRFDAFGADKNWCSCTIWKICQSNLGVVLHFAPDLGWFFTYPNLLYFLIKPLMVPNTIPVASCINLNVLPCLNKSITKLRWACDHSLVLTPTLGNINDKSNNFEKYQFF